MNQQQEEQFRARQKKWRPLLIIIFLFMLMIAIGYGYIHRNDLKNSRAYTFDQVSVGVLFKYDFAPKLIPLLPSESTGGPYSFYLGSGVGFPPMGLKLDMYGVLKGTPTGTGDSKFQVCVKDVGGRSACNKYSMSVVPKTTASKSGKTLAPTSTPTPNKNVVQGTTRSEKWEGTYNNHEVFDSGWACTTDVTAPVSICMTWQGQNFTGITNYPGGLKATYTNNPDDICPHLPVANLCAGGPCGGDVNISGYIGANGNLNFDSLLLPVGLSYSPKIPNGSYGTINSAVMAGNSMTVEYSSAQQVTTHTTDTNKGSFTATKVSDSCN